MVSLLNAEDYKTICSRAETVPRGVIEASERIVFSVNPPLALLLREILDSPPIPKPPLHSGEKHTDYHSIQIDLDNAEKIVEYLIDAEAEAVGRNGETTAEASRIGLLVDVWTGYIDYRKASK